MLPLANLLVEKEDDRPLFLHDGGLVTVSQFRQWVAALREQAGPRLAGKRIAIEVCTPLQFCACLYAVWTSSGAVVLLPNAAHVKSSDPATHDAVISTKNIDLGLGRSCDAELAVPRGAQLILFTSGSSGEPKRLVKSVQQIQDEQAHLSSIIGNAYQDALIAGSVSPHHFYGIVFLVFASLAHGGIILDKMPAGLREADERISCLEKSVFVSSPATLDRLTELKSADLPYGQSVTVISAGGQLRQETREKFSSQTSSRLIEIYGSSESGVIAHRGAALNEPWQVLPGVTLQSLGNEGTRVTSAYADNGCITLADSVSPGKTPGTFSLNGRLDRIVKVEERRLSLPEMEDALKSHPMVADAACCAIRPVGASRTVIAAALVVKQDSASTAPAARPALEQSLRRLLLERFHITLVPRQWRVVPEIPRNSIGKVSQRDLIKLFESN